MIDIIGTDRGAHELLHEEVFLIGGPGAGESGNGIRAIHGFEIKEFLGRVIIGLIPTGLNQHTVLADQGFGQSLFMLDKVMAKTALDT